MDFPNFYLPSGNVVGGRAEGWPCDGVITQVYGQISVTGSRHGGMDIANRKRTPLYAPVPGPAYTFPKEMGYSFGNFVSIAWDGMGLYVGMAHLDEIAVPNGAWVSEGELIGWMGSTGLSTGDHVHLAVCTEMLFPLDFTKLRDPSLFATQEEDDMGMTPDERARLENLEKLVATNGMMGVPYPNVIHLFPQGTEEVPEGSDGPWYRLAGNAALEYANIRGFAFGLAVQNILINPPLPEHSHAHGLRATGSSTPAAAVHASLHGVADDGSGELAHPGSPGEGEPEE